MKDIELRRAGPIYRDSHGDFQIGRTLLSWNTGRQPGDGAISRCLTSYLLFRPGCWTLGVVVAGTPFNRYVQVFVLPCVAIYFHLESSFGGYFSSRRAAK